MANQDLKQDINKQELEISLLIDAIKACYGIDFTHYKKASLKRRLQHNLEKNKFSHISEMISKAIWSYSYFEQLLFDISIPVTEMYRDPCFYAAINQKVLPFLKTFPQPRIWITGCATGEEAYSLAILLHEANCLDKFEIIATDFNKQALEQAYRGIYSIETILHYELNYKKAGGQHSLLNYFTRQDNTVEILSIIKDKIIFLEHDLTGNHGLKNVHLILCRNVFIYFDRTLQQHVSNLFYQSLCPGGFLGLGLKESLDFIEKHDFENYEPKLRIYQKCYQ